MANKSKQHDKEFKLNAVKYVEEHPDFTQVQCAKNLNIGLSTLSKWRRCFLSNRFSPLGMGSFFYTHLEFTQNILCYPFLNLCHNF